jgi:hypothetical protein
MEMGLIAIGAGSRWAFRRWPRRSPRRESGPRRSGVVEKPETFGTVLILLVIPETLAILVYGGDPADVRVEVTGIRLGRGYGLRGVDPGPAVGGRSEGA